MNNINEVLEMKLIDTKDRNNIDLLQRYMIAEALKRVRNPFINLTVKDVAKDLKMGENLTNELFKRKDFPSVNIGKQKTVTLLAYLLWKMQKQDNFEKGNKDNEY